MIVQYNTPDSSIPADIAPYPLKISWSSNRWKCSSTIFLPIILFWIIQIKSLLKILKVGLKNRDYIT
jgi:hypothetical protein